MELDDIDYLKNSLDQYAQDNSKANKKELNSCIKYIKKNYPVEVYASIFHVYSALMEVND